MKNGERMHISTEDSTLNKLILLYIFDSMGMPLAESTIMDLCQNKNTWIDYVGCKFALEQLVEAGFLAKLEQRKDETYYNLTADGRVCLGHFFIRIPSSLREEITSFVKNSKMIYRRKQEYASSYKKRSDGTYDVTLSIIDTVLPALEIKINVPTRNIAKHIDETWGEKAANIYAQLYDGLVE
jgi:predicted transcriptional regulator